MLALQLLVGLVALFCLMEAAPAPQPRDLPTAVATAIAAEALIAKGKPTGHPPTVEDTISSSLLRTPRLRDSLKSENLAKGTL